MTSGGGEHGDRPRVGVLQDAERIAAVARVVAHGPAGDRLDRIVDFAAELLGAPFAQLSLLTATEQIVAAAHGFVVDDEARRSPIEESLCSVTAASGQPLVVPDARSHPWVQDLPPVASGAVGSYLGVVLTDAAGQVLGSLCVYDKMPRSWSPEQVDQLTIVARLVSAEMGGHAQRPQSDSTGLRAQLAADAAELGSFVLHFDAVGEVDWDDRMKALHGFTVDTFGGTPAAYQSVVHPEDWPVLMQRLAHARDTLGEFSAEYRVLVADGGRRWIRIRGRVMPDMLGNPSHVLGAAYDASAERGLRDELIHLMETMPAALLRIDRDWRISYANSVTEALYGRARDELVGVDLWEAFPNSRGTVFEDEYEKAMDTGEPGMVDAYVEALQARIEVRIWPDEQGLTLFFEDVTERHRAQLALDRVGERLAVLADAGSRLGGSLRPFEVLDVLDDLVVPTLATSMTLTVTDSVAELLGLSAGNDPTKLHQVDLQRASAAVDSPGPLLSVPLRSPGGVLGAFTVSGSDEQPLDEVLLLDIANRAAVALENALSYARQHEAATVLQRALLPRTSPGVQDVTVATRYLPANARSLAGGDFFKTVNVNGRLVCALGDVMGHGTASAARAGQLHGLVAALALQGLGPAELLTQLGAGIGQMMDLELATLLVCSYDPVTRLLTAATAGHPPPLLAPVVGDPFFLDLPPGIPVGVGADTYVEVTVPLPVGATAVLFSDGLVETRTASISDGLERLRLAVAELRLPPEAVADHILSSLGAEHGGDDDIALLVMSHL